MSEEKKNEVEKQEEEKKSSEVAKTVFKYVLGVVLLGLGIGAIIGLWEAVWILIKGCIGPFLVLAGVITIAIARE